MLDPEYIDPDTYCEIYPSRTIPSPIARIVQLFILQASTTYPYWAELEKLLKQNPTFLELRIGETVESQPL